MMTELHRQNCSPSTVKFRWPVRVREMAWIIPFALLLAVEQTTYAQASFLTPELINYEGTLKTANGNPIPDGEYDMEFRIYAIFFGLLWGPMEFDSQPGNGHTQKVIVTNGRFNAVIGPTDTSNQNLLTQLQLVAGVGAALALEITVEGVPLSPVHLMLPTPFAMVASNGFPKGSIVIWSGSTLPAGWAFCDGTNGTPDLRSRFIKGAGGTGFDQINTPGGTANHSHTLPSHSHADSHSHTISHTHTIAAHSHSVDPPSTTSSSPSNNSSIINGALESKDFSKSHSHTLDIASFTSGANSAETTGGSSSGFTTSVIPSGDSSAAAGTPSSTHEPAFYTLAFIMKL
jgi:hypothetical protein